MSTSLRLRLTIWYATLLALILAATSYLSYSFHSISHYDDVDRSLASLTVTTRDSLMASPTQFFDDGTLVILSLEDNASPEIYVRFYDGSGRILASSPNAGRMPKFDPEVTGLIREDSDRGSLTDRLVRSVLQATQPNLPEEGSFFTAIEPGAGRRTRLYTLPVDGGEQVRGYLEAGSPLDQIDHSLARLRALLTLAAAIGLLAALLGGWLIAAGALRPIATLASTARAIAVSRNFSQRLPKPGRRDELGTLAGTFNEMLLSLDEAYQNQRRFIDDASHELRAPLTAIQGNLELLERMPELNEAERIEVLTCVRQEAQRMGRLIADLLMLARADAGQSLHTQPVDLDRVLVDLFRENMARAGDRKLLLGGLSPARVQGDPDRLKQLLLILVDNAINYTPAGEKYACPFELSPAAHSLRCQIPESEWSRRTYPTSSNDFTVRTRLAPGIKEARGLGLAIAQWIAEQHGGRIDTQSTPGKGSNFTLQIPLH